MTKENDMNLIAKKRLKTHHQIIFLLVSMILGNCGSVTPISTSTSQSPAKTAISSIVEPLVTSMPATTKHNTPTASENAHGAPQAEGHTPTLDNLPPETIVKFQSYEMKSGASLNEKPMGALVLCGDFTIQLLHFVPEVKVETMLESSDDIYCYATSPDGKWIAYDQDSDESPTGRWLIVQSVDGQQKKLPSDEHWIGFGDHIWLDNQRLIFNDFSNPPDIQRSQTYRAYPMVVVNPFSGKQTKLSSNYSELHSDICGPASSMDFNISDVVYDPSLNLVIFPSWSGEHNYIVLWDRRSKTILAKVETQSACFGYYPLWSPDATQFAVVANSNAKIMEWYSVSRKGQVEQLTHFGDYFSSSEIGYGSNWSPDGKKLAFWMDLEPSPCSGPRLGILDTTTKQVINTCLTGSWDYAPTPIWSLDSQYIVIRNYDRVSPVKTTLVDVENAQAFDITNYIDHAPYGWLQYNE